MIKANKNFILIIVPLFFFITSCNNQRDVNLSTNRDLDSLKKAVIANGDVNAYNLLRKESLESGQFESIGFSLIMANKYKYLPACRDFASSFMDWYHVNQDSDSVDLTKVDSDSRRLILKYLFLACKTKEQLDSNRVKTLKATDVFVNDIIEAKRQSLLW